MTSRLHLVWRSPAWPCVALTVVGLGHAGAGVGGAGRSTPRTARPRLCDDAPIEGPISIGSAMPLSGGAAAALRAGRRGLEAYIDYANENDLLPGYEIEVTSGTTSTTRR